MTASVCHRSFDLPMGHVSALLPTLQRAWNTNQRAFDSSALTGVLAAPIQVHATVGKDEDSEARENVVDGPWGLVLQSSQPGARGEYGEALSTVPASYVNCYMVQ